MITTAHVAVEKDPGTVWRVGNGPDLWAWASWQFADDDGRMGGRWDDQNAQFRTLYTSQELVGCFLELVAQLQPAKTAYAELDEIENDGSADGGVFPGDPQRGAIGHEWGENRFFGSADQTGVYADVTHSQSLGALKDSGVFDLFGIPPNIVDVSVLKNPQNRDLTRTIARWVFDQHGGDRLPVFDGVAFRSRMGDDILLWAVFERGNERRSSRCLKPTSDPERVSNDNIALIDAMRRLGLHWEGELDEIRHLEPESWGDTLTEEQIYALFPSK